MQKKVMKTYFGDSREIMYLVPNCVYSGNGKPDREGSERVTNLSHFG